MNKLRYTLLSVLFCFYSLLTVNAQSIAVASFQLLQDDTSAILEGTMKYDQNGEKCAIIKIETTQSGFTFDAGTLGVVDQIQKVGEIWLYLPEGVRRLTIAHPQLGVLRNYDLGLSLQKGKTYLLQLTTGKVHTYVEEDDGMRYFTLTVTPANAFVKVDGEPQALDADGSLMLRLKQGQHSYEISAVGYFSKNDSFILGNDRYSETIILETKLAEVSLYCPTNSAKLYVNDVYKADGSWNGSLTPGNYLFEARQQGYITQKKSVTLAEKDKTNVNFTELIPITGKLDVAYKPIDSEVYLDGKYLGMSPSTFKEVLIGSHKVEIKKDGYVSASISVTIEEGKTATLSGQLQKSEVKTLSQTQLTQPASVDKPLYDEDEYIPDEPVKVYFDDPSIKKAIQLNIKKASDYLKKGMIQEARMYINSALLSKPVRSLEGDVFRLAAEIEYANYQKLLPEAAKGDGNVLNRFFESCGKGFDYYMEAWKSYNSTYNDFKPNHKYNDDMATKAWDLYSVSTGLVNCGFTAYNAQNWGAAAKYFELAANGAESAIIKHATAKNPAAALENEKYLSDEVKYQNILYSASCYDNFDKEKALSLFKSLVGKNTPQLPVYSSIIGEYAQKNDTTEMINWLQKGMEAMPGEGYFTTSLFQIYLDRKDIDGAINAMKAALTSNPTNAGIVTIIARLYTQKAEYAPAKEYFQKALELNPNSLDANLYYGYTYLAEMETGEKEMLDSHASNDELDRFSEAMIKSALPLLRKAYKLDKKHENNDIPNLLMQVLYRQFAPTNAPNRQALINEYNEVARAYGRPEKN